MRNVSRADLRDQLRLRTDTQNETRRFPDSEMNYYLNEGIAAFHAEMVRARGQGFSESYSIIPTASGQEFYALPAAVLEVVKVLTYIDNAERVLHTYEEWDTQGIVDNVSWKASNQAFRYRIVGDNISLRPIPSDVVNVTVKYVATAVKLTADANTVDGVDGLEEYVICWAGRRVAIKQRDWELRDACAAECAEVLERLQALQRQRNAAEPPRMQDVKTHFLAWRRFSRRFPPA